jgi:lipopolysaccharide/colanic/teichoic acid biosynthesis glycosyltransferase
MDKKRQNKPGPTSQLKELIDQAASWAAWIMLSPLMYFLALGVRLDNPGTAFFRQERIGKDGRPFVVYKFRTMRAEPPGAQEHQPVSEQGRITKFGGLLRNTSLDELPQLINIINGEMSLVGPRPTLRYQVAAYNDSQWRRLLVKPGITGWAQIHGRNAIPWAERIGLDVWYVENWSLKLDWQILGQTVQIWLKREGLYGPGGINDDFIKAAAPYGQGLKISCQENLS